MKKCLRLLVALSALMSVSVAAAEKSKHFSIRMHDKLIGYAVAETQRVQRDGQDLLALKSETSLRVALLGKERSTLLTSETLVEPGSGRPYRYKMTDKTNQVIRHVECQFAKGLARTWIYREGDPRGTAIETKLPDGWVILGSNNFAHWYRLAAVAGKRGQTGKLTVPIFLPDTRSVTNFSITRGKTREVTVPGGKRACTAWNINGSLIMLADAKTHEFVRLELPGQDTVITQADKAVIKLARKSRAEEILARHFAQSNVVFDDMLKVNKLVAKVDVSVIGSGVADDTSVLTTGMQKFTGTKERNRIVGTVHIQGIPFDPRTSPAFPSKTAADLSQWLAPSNYIESDHDSIVAKSAELTKGAKTRWQAVERIGRWVYKEIAYTIADTPSARLALEKKQGDCGPHSTLMVAMLRAAGVPARLVGGLVYTPTFGGSFGQHAWVEVHMGKAGWVAIDPTSGEFRQISATHIKLFSGIGGVLPKSIQVVSFNPPNQKVDQVAGGKSRPLAWKLNQQHEYTFTKGGKKLGSEMVTIAKDKRGGKDVYKLTSKIKLKINAFVSLVADSSLIVQKNCQPLVYQRDLAAGLQKVKFNCTFKDGVVAAKISGAKNLSRDVKLPAGAYCFDNNLMGCFTLICSQLKLEPKKAVTVRTFHPSSLQIIPLTLTPKSATKIKIGGKSVECFECEVAPIKNTFWITRDGRFVRAQQGDLVIELVKLH